MKYLFLFFAFVSFIPPAHAESYDQRLISVSGTCYKKVVPDRGEIRLLADIKSKKREEATRIMTQTYNKMLDDVKALNLDDLELNTENYAVYPIYEGSYNDRELVGYQSRIALKVSTSAISKLGQAIEIGHNVPYISSNGFNTYVARETMQAAQESCFVTALENAQSKAKKLATTGHSKLGKVLDIRESGPIHLSNRPRNARYSASNALAASSAPKIEAGPENLQVTIYAVFELK